MRIVMAMLVSTYDLTFAFSCRNLDPAKKSRILFLRL